MSERPKYGPGDKVKAGNWVTEVFEVVGHYGDGWFYMVDHPEARLWGYYEHELEPADACEDGCPNPAEHARLEGLSARLDAMEAEAGRG